MITFTCCLIALIVGYFTYGKFVERVFGVDPSRVTPAFTKQDGVDYIPLPTWKIFMIQFLNIAGLGPIFGAIMGAKFGVASFLWIVLGSIFAGATHDFLSGMLSLRHDGESLPELIGRYLGNNFKQFMRGFTVILMILVGAVFVAGPAGLLAKLTPEYLDATFWIIVVFIYYILATLLPVDKIIGKIYPLFAIALLFMAVGILVMLFINQPPLPEITDGLSNTHPGGLPIFPIMFVSIACGAISGFHATQSPLMARCMKSEKYARPVFYGAMITEGIVALIWAAAAFREEKFRPEPEQYTELLDTRIQIRPDFRDKLIEQLKGTFGKYYDYHRRDIAANEVDYLNVEDPDVFSHRAWELEYQKKQEMRRNQPARTKKRSYDMEL